MVENLTKTPYKNTWKWHMVTFAWKPIGTAHASMLMMEVLHIIPYFVIRIFKNCRSFAHILQRHITKTHVRGLFACDYHQTSTVWRFKPATVPSGKISTSGKNPSMTAFAFSTEELPCTAFFIVSTPNWARRLNKIEEKRRIILVPTK